MISTKTEFKHNCGRNIYLAVAQRINSINIYCILNVSSNVNGYRLKVCHLLFKECY